MTTADTGKTAPISVAERMALVRAAKKQKNENSPATSRRSTVFCDSTALRGWYTVSPDDEKHWLELARQRNVKLPQHNTPCTPAAMIRWLHKLGLSLAWYQEYTGYKKLQQWIDASPAARLRWFVGLLLEELE